MNWKGFSVFQEEKASKAAAGGEDAELANLADTSMDSKPAAGILLYRKHGEDTCYLEPTDRIGSCLSSLF